MRDKKGVLSSTTSTDVTTTTLVVKPYYIYKGRVILDYGIEPILAFDLLLTELLKRLEAMLRRRSLAG